MKKALFFNELRIRGQQEVRIFYTFYNCLEKGLTQLQLAEKIGTKQLTSSTINFNPSESRAPSSP
ncbi:hypothetical protein KKH50_00555 [Patescibacteria group bacterium]|nr:hypothetical protein [Patescibacteria group bacterium]